MNLAGHVMKSCEGPKGFSEELITYYTNQVHIPMNFLTLLFITFILHMEKANRPELLKLLCFLFTIIQPTADKCVR